MMTTLALHPRPVTPTRRRPGGRSERVRRAVGEAVIGFLAEERPEFTVSELAMRAGVDRRTLYRWWPTRADLVLEGLSLFYAELRPPDTGSWRDDIQALAASLARYFADPVIVGINVLLATGRYPVLSAGVMDFWRPAIDSLGVIARRAVDRGELDPGIDHSVVLQLLIGPLLVQTVLMHAELTPAFVQSIAGAVARIAVIRDQS